MPESVGKKLAQARLQRGLSLDEVAHATKLRPEKILALENDDLTCFPSNAYAKGHLKNYARYLDVDVSAYLTTIDSTLPISVAEYQYLSNAPERLPDPEPFRRERKPPSILPIFFAVATLFLSFASVWMYANWQRIFAPPLHQVITTTSAPTPAPTLPPVSPDLTSPSTLSLEPNPVLEPSTAPEPAPAASDDTALLKPKPVGDPMDHDFVVPTPVASTDPTPVVPAQGENEVLIASLKKTWITVRGDDPKAKPLFDDYLYPDVRPLKLRGTRFFIEARDPTAVQITKNGLPIAYQSASVTVQ